MVRTDVGLSHRERRLRVGAHPEQPDESPRRGDAGGRDRLESANPPILGIRSSREVKFRLGPVCPAGPGIYVRFVIMRGLFPDPGPAIAMYVGPAAGGDRASEASERPAREPDGRPS